MLLTKRKSARRGLLRAAKAQRAASQAVLLDAALDHEKQLAVVDAVEWAVERWASQDRLDSSAADPRAAHASHLLRALTYLDWRFERLDLAFVTQIIESVAAAPAEGQAGPRLDAKAAATLLAVEVGAFRR